MTSASTQQTRRENNGRLGSEYQLILGSSGYSNTIPLVRAFG